MRSFIESLTSGKFMVTTELISPKGTHLTPLFEKAEALRDQVDAIIIPDSHAAQMSMSPLAVAHLLINRGIEPILSITCRGRNRIALQSDLLGAHALGIKNIVCMTGDHPAVGDHPEATPVFDLDSISLLRAIASHRAGKDMSGHRLTGISAFSAGAVVDPAITNQNQQMRRMEMKVAAGAQFFFTQAVFDPLLFKSFMRTASRFGVPIIAGLIVLKSGDMARRLNAGLLGITVPDVLIDEMDRAEDPERTGTEIATRTIKDLMSLCQGVHLVSVGREYQISSVLKAAGIASDSSLRER
ncbi:MAG TPA: methylenetetrahydrofolate reductase [SAR202 cluster bacterium]|nr:methylenetetrahydrofolate reductase [SAR202 cluster bacterium]HJO59544.1 methylenetetrahydrofolate reductase [SAR202 cluster bacterium]